MTGPITVRANWTANAYSIAYNANGGSGTIAATELEYDREGAIATNAFVRSGYLFLGWATSADGPVIYEPGAAVMNLTANADAVLTLFAVWEQENVSDPVITPADGSTFKTASCTVTIICETEGATIYCSKNGRPPSARDAFLYTGPFEITDTATIVAFAVKGEKQSDLVEATITKVGSVPMTLIGVIDETKLYDVATGGEADWDPVEEEFAKAGSSLAQSGAIGMEQSTWLEAKVYGPGTFTFWWKVSCEPDPRKRYTYDHVEVSADGEAKAKLDGESGWVQQTIDFETDGEHVIRWTYLTDDWEEPGYADCAWVDVVTWSGQVKSEEEPMTETQTTTVPVPVSWLKTHYPTGTDWESLAKGPCANGVNTVEEAYIAGFDPTDPEDEVYRCGDDFQRHGARLLDAEPQYERHGASLSRERQERFV